MLNKIDSTHKELKNAQLSSNPDNLLIKKLTEQFTTLNQKAASLSNPNEFGTILDMHGAVGPNAYCSYDMTAFWVELPSNKVELWALLESDRLFNPVFRGFYEELEVVKEERRMRVDNSPFGKLMEEFNSVAYKLHPYRNPIIGYSEDLNNMSREKVKDFYKKYYIPSNIVIGVVGDVDPKRFIPLVEKYFGNIPSGERPVINIPQDPTNISEKSLNIKMDSQPILLMGFRIPNSEDSDIPALEVSSELLAGGRTSLLYQKLVKKDKSAVSTGSWCWAPQHPGIFYLWAISSKDGNNTQIETSIYEMLEKIKEGKVTEEELSGAKARLKMQLLTFLKSRRGLAKELTWYKAVTGDWRNLFKYEEELTKVTLQDIIRVSQKYFVEENKIVGKVEPRNPVKKEVGEGQ